MVSWEKAKKPALNIEEAALLPARERRGAGAGLRWAIQAARAMEEKKVSNAVTGAFAAKRPAAPRAEAPVRRRGEGAALRHVLRSRPCDPAGR